MGNPKRLKWSRSLTGAFHYKVYDAVRMGFRKLRWSYQTRAGRLQERGVARRASTVPKPLFNLRRALPSGSPTGGIIVKHLSMGDSRGEETREKAKNNWNEI